MTFMHKLTKRLALNGIGRGVAPDDSPANRAESPHACPSSSNRLEHAHVRTRPRTGLIVALLAAAACEGQPDLYSPEMQNAIGQVRVWPRSASLQSGQGTQFTAFGFLTEQDSIPAVVTWTATGGTIGQDGAFTAGSDAGQFAVVATHAQKLWLSDSSMVEVAFPQPPLVGLVVQPRDPVLALGDSLAFAALGITATGDTTLVEVTWSGEGGSVQSNGKGKGLYKPDRPGRHKLRASTDSLADSTVVTVTSVSVATVEVSPAAVSVPVGQTVQLTATPRDSAGNLLSDRPVTWTSGGSGVATVSGNGLVTAVAAGTATVTATSESQSGSTLVTVSAPQVASVSVTPASLVIQVGGTGQLTATPRDAAGNALTGRAVSWASNSTTVAGVTGNGLVSALASGTATITATVDNVVGTSGLTVVPEGGVAPVFEETWDYEDSQDMRSNPNGWFGNDKPPGGGVPMSVRSSLALDTIGPSGVGVGKSLRIGQASRHYQDWWDWTGGTGSPAYDPNGSYPQSAVGTTIGKSIVFPGGPVGTEMWVEVWYRLSPGWNVAWADELNSGASEGLKMMFFGTSNGTNGRLEVKLFNRTWAVGESTVDVKEVGLDGPGTNRNLPFGTTGYWPEGFNDVWHYWRVHIKGSTSGNRDGFFRFHDGKQLRFGPAALGGEKQDLENRSMDVGNGFDDLEVGVNMNVGPWNTNEVTPANGVSMTTGYMPGDHGGPIPANWRPGQYYWFGPIRVWTQDPGWGW